MALFRYKWVPRFSRSLCVMIVRESENIKSLSLEINSLFGRPIDWTVGKGMLNRIFALIGSLDIIIFSGSALMYRLEKDLIKFVKEVESSAQRLIIESKREKDVQARFAQQLQSAKKGEKKQKPQRGLEKISEEERRRLAEIESRKKGELMLLKELTGFIWELDGRIDDMRLEGKAQKRGVINPYAVRESITIRSNYRLGRVIKRRGIQFALLIKAIRQRLEYLGSVVKRGKVVTASDASELIKHCRKEAEDLGNVFLYAIQLSKRLEARLNLLLEMIKSNPKLRLLAEDYYKTRKRLYILRSDIEVQQKRLSNEFKKSGFAPQAEIQREMKSAA